MPRRTSFNGRPVKRAPIMEPTTICATRDQLDRRLRRSNAQDMERGAGDHRPDQRIGRQAQQARAEEAGNCRRRSATAHRPISNGMLLT